MDRTRIGVDRFMIPKQEISIKNDRKLAIATATSRHAKKWKNKEILWSDFLDMLAHPTVTQESFKEYLGLSKTQQGEIKDVGGFVGGTLAGGRRRAGSVNWRSVITLDIDSGKGDIWSTVEFALEDVTCAMYSTHKHTNAAPRVRLIIPLSRNVSAEEYEPIARRVASEVGINMMDKTTYQPERLMFWASVSKDGDYLFEHQEGSFMDPDKILATYKDWKDSYEWPTADDEHAQITKLGKKQGNPLEKNGFIGAFNRAYTIPEAIEAFIPDDYTHFKDDRYTYSEGSTAGGLILYQDGLFAYSHHGTSPTSGQLTNAFDFIRLHLFGEQDLDIDSTMPYNRVPSYKSMIEMLQSDDKTNGEMLQLKDLPFEIMDDETEGTTVEEVKAWTSRIKKDLRGVNLSTGANARLIIENDPNLKGKIRMDEFQKRFVVHGELPWPRVGTEWTDSDDGSLCTYLEEFYEITGDKKVINALNEVAIKNRFHPIKQYFETLKWDGKERAERLFIDYFGAEDSPYTRAVTRIHLTAAIARIKVPGIKYDTALVLAGSQGSGKSLLIDKLGKGWTNDSLLSVDNKDALEGLQGSWLIELAEMSATRRAENEAIKHFLSKREDKYRASYGRRTETYPRQCVFFGTSNNPEFLKDSTGNRRFYPIKTNEKARTKVPWVDFTSSEVDQVWAEVMTWYEAGESIYLREELQGEASRIQELFKEEAPTAAMIREFVETPVPEDWLSRDIVSRRNYLAGTSFEDEDVKLVPRTRICAAEIWVECYGKDAANLDRIRSREINDVLGSLPNYSRSSKTMRFGPKYGAQKGFIREGFIG